MVNRGKYGRQIRHIMATGKGTLGAIDWTSIINSGLDAAGTIISSTTKPTTTNSGTYVPGTNIYIPGNSNQSSGTTDYTPWLIGGGLLLAAGIGFVALNNSNKSKR